MAVIAVLEGLSGVVRSSGDVMLVILVMYAGLSVRRMSAMRTYGPIARLSGVDSRQRFVSYV